MDITDFGAFLDLGGVDGLLYITDISWGRINHPEEIVKLDDKIQVVILEFDDEKYKSEDYLNFCFDTGEYIFGDKKIKLIEGFSPVIPSPN